MKKSSLEAGYMMKYKMSLLLLLLLQYLSNINRYLALKHKIFNLSKSLMIAQHIDIFPHMTIHRE